MSAGRSLCISCVSTYTRRTKKRRQTRAERPGSCGEMQRSSDPDAHATSDRRNATERGRRRAQFWLLDCTHDVRTKRHLHTHMYIYIYIYISIYLYLYTAVHTEKTRRVCTRDTQEQQRQMEETQKTQQLRVSTCTELLSRRERRERRERWGCVRVWGCVRRSVHRTALDALCGRGCSERSTASVSAVRGWTLAKGRRGWCRDWSGGWHCRGRPAASHVPRAAHTLRTKTHSRVCWTRRGGCLRCTLSLHWCMHSACVRCTQRVMHDHRLYSFLFHSAFLFIICLLHCLLSGHGSLVSGDEQLSEARFAQITHSSEKRNKQSPGRSFKRIQLREESACERPLL